MPHIKPKARGDLAELEDVFQRAESALGFVPTSFFMMGRKPAILRAFSKLSREVVGVPGAVPLDLKWLVAHAASSAAGCQYCAAHTGAAAAGRANVPTDKVAAVAEPEADQTFSAAEQAALDFARAAATQPNEVAKVHFDALLEHFDEDQIVEIMAVISLFGWLNRWNDSMATALEEDPLQFGETHLAQTGWSIGRHGEKA